MNICLLLSVVLHLCNELITIPEESYRLWCVVVCDLETSITGRPWPAFGIYISSGGDHLEEKVCKMLYICDAARGIAACWDTALQAGRSRVQFPVVSLEIFIHIIFPAALWRRVDTTSNRSDYQEYFLGDKVGRCLRLTALPPSYTCRHDIWEPQLPEILRAFPGL
jgi:hypothetical protein